MSTFNSVFFQKLFCEVHEMELFFAARAEPIRKTIACQTFPQKIHQIFLQKRETKEVHDAGRSQEGPAGVNSPGEKSSVPMVFFCSTKVFPYRKAPVRSRAGAEAAISPYRSPLFSQRAFPWYPHRDSAGFWLRLMDRPHPFPCPRRRRKVRSHSEIPARSAFQGEQ